MVKVDFTGVSDQFEPVPEGTYDAVLTSFEIRDTKDGSSKLVNLEFTISDDPEWTGRKVWTNRSLKPQALWALKRVMVALGTDSERLAGPVDIEEELEDLVGSECRLDLSVREYDGKERNEITEVRSVTLGV